MDKKKIILLPLVAALLFVGCKPTVLEDADAYITEGNPAETVSEEIKLLAGGDISKMEQVARTDRFTMHMNLTTAEFVITDNQTKEQYASNPAKWKEDPKADDKYKNELGSQLTVEYIGTDGKPAAMTSYNDSFLLGQIECQLIDNGVKATYQLGTASPQRNFPTCIRAEAFLELLDKMPENKQTMVKSAYRLVDPDKSSKEAVEEVARLYPGIHEHGAIYVMRPNLGKQQLNNIEQQFKDIKYSFDDIKKEHQILGYDAEANQTASFIIPVEYKLEDEGFSATLISEDIKTVKGFNLTKVNILPFFGASDSSATGEFLVPDGSGALIELNKETSHGFTYSANIYGNDPALYQTIKTFYAQTACLPVYGVLSDQNAYLAVISEGAGSGLVSAATSGIFSSYNIMYASFSPKASDYLSYDLTTGTGKSTVNPLVSSKQRFRVDYFFLDGTPDFIAAADVYRSYLQKSGVLNTDSKHSSVPVTVELVGALEKRETFLGVPYNTTVALTTFSQAEDIMSRLKDTGLGNLNLRMTAWANGGMDNTVFNKVSPVGALGGKKALTALNAFLKTNGIGFYPDLEMNFVSKDTAFDGFSPSSDGAKMINRQVARIAGIDLSTGARSLGSSSVKYIVSAAKRESYLEQCLSYLNKQGIEGVSLGSMGTVLASDYNQKNPIDRAKSELMLKETLNSQLTGKFSAITEGGNAYMLPYVSGIVNMPMDASSLEVESRSVPFYQAVLHGTGVTYAGEPVNMAVDYQRNILKSAETGAALYCKWIAADNYALQGSGKYELYSAAESSWFDDMVKLYGRYNEQVSPVTNAKIISHKILDGNVNATGFEGGYIMLTNYGDEKVTTDYGEVEAKDYRLVKGALN